MWWLILSLLGVLLLAAFAANRARIQRQEILTTSNDSAEIVLLLR